MTMVPAKQNKSPREWKGYTFEQLVYERAVALARIEVEKEITAINYDRVKQGNFGMASGLFSRVMGALNYADYFVIIMQLYRHISPLFKKKKK